MCLLSAKQCLSTLHMLTHWSFPTLWGSTIIFSILQRRKPNPPPPKKKELVSGRSVFNPRCYGTRAWTLHLQAIWPLDYPQLSYSIFDLGAGQSKIHMAIPIPMAIPQISYPDTLGLQCKTPNIWLLGHFTWFVLGVMQFLPWFP